MCENRSSQMKVKRRLITLFMLIVAANLYAFDPIADLNEVGVIYPLNTELLKIEYADDYDDEDFSSKLELIWPEESLRSVYFKNYLLQTEKESIKRSVLDYFTANNINDSYSKAIKTKYNMTEAMDKNNTCEKRLTYNDEIFDEEVNFSLFTLNKYFSDRLQVIYPWNSYSQFVVADDEEKGDSKILMVGGGTNTVTVFLNKYDDSDGEEYDKLLNQQVNKEKYEKVYQFDVDEYMFNNGNVQDASFVFAEGADTFFKGNIRNFDCCLVVHSKTGETYKINYFVNMSTSNVNYDNYFDLYRLFCMYCLMTVVK